MHRSFNRAVRVYVCGGSSGSQHSRISLQYLSKYRINKIFHVTLEVRCHFRLNTSLLLNIKFPVVYEQIWTAPDFLQQLARIFNILISVTKQRDPTIVHILAIVRVSFVGVAVPRHCPGNAQVILTEANRLTMTRV